MKELYYCKLFSRQKMIVQATRFNYISKFSTFMFSRENFKLKGQ